MKLALCLLALLPLVYSAELTFEEKRWFLDSVSLSCMIFFEITFLFMTFYFFKPFRNNWKKVLSQELANHQILSTVLSASLGKTC